MNLLPGRHEFSKSVTGNYGKCVFCIVEGKFRSTVSTISSKYSAIGRPCASQGAAVENRTDLIGELIVAMVQPRERGCVLNHLALLF